MPISRRRLLAASPFVFTPAGISAETDANIIKAEDAKDRDAEVHRFEEITEASERALERGTQFLAKTEQRNGGYGVDISTKSDIGCTAMVGLSLLARGNTALEGRHANRIRRITQFMLDKVSRMPADDITSDTSTQIQNKIGRHAHSFFAALFMSQVMGQGKSVERVQPSLKKLVDAVVRGQTAEGNWRGQSWAPTLGTVMGWSSLRTADLAGIKTGGAPDKVASYLIKQMKKELGKLKGGGGNWMHTLYKNATGIRVLYAMGMENEEISKRAFKDVRQLVNKDNTAFTQAGGEEYLAFHLITETMLQKGGADWKLWFPTLRDKIISVQNRDGSWAGAHCITSRTFCTAAACLVLAAPYRYLPASQQ